MLIIFLTRKHSHITVFIDRSDSLLVQNQNLIIAAYGPS